LITGASGILDHPHARVMTNWLLLRPTSHVCWPVKG
jgi:hypothetical protein